MLEFTYIEDEKSKKEILEVPRAIKHVYTVNDDYRTPRYLVSCLEPFIIDFMKKNNINRQLVVWCPFDTQDSEYVRYFKESSAKVIYGDIKTGEDFFKVSVPECDLVISNPPFSRKREIMSKLFAAKIPFALLMNLQAMQYQEMGQLFYEEAERSEDVQFIIPDKKVSFDGNTAAFCSGYYCWKFVEKTHFVHLPHNNSRKYYVPAYSLIKEGA